MHFFDRVYKELVEFSNDTGNDNQAQVEECIRYCCVLVITNLKDHRIWSYCDDIIGNYWTMTIMGQFFVQIQSKSINKSRFTDVTDIFPIFRFVFTLNMDPYA